MTRMKGRPNPDEFMYRKLVFIAIILMALILPASADYTQYNVTFGQEYCSPYYPGADHYEVRQYAVGGAHMSSSSATHTPCHVFGSILPGEQIGGYSSGNNTLVDKMIIMYHNGGTLVPANYANYFVRNASLVKNVTFVITQTGSPSTPVSGAMVTLSNGQYAATNASGMATIDVFPAASTYTYRVDKIGWFSIIDAALGLYGQNGGVLYTTLTPSGNGILAYLDVRSALDAGNPLVYNASVSIINTTSSVSRTAIAPYGSASFNSTGASYEWPLSVGQNLRFAASSVGYNSETINVTLAFSGQVSTIYLTRNNQSLNNGTWNPVVHVHDVNYPNTNIPNAKVRIETGINGKCSVYPGCIAYTNSQGIATFQDLPASTLANIFASAVGYQDGNIVVQVNPNRTMMIDMLLLQIGQTPSVTPLETTPAIPGNVTPTTQAPYPTITDDEGNPITSPEGKANYALQIFIDALITIASIVVGVVLIWLMWMVVYMITGGKIIDKIMRRGRGGRR